MTFERAMVILFTKVAQTVIAERFTHTFFDNDGNRVRKVFAYLFSVFIAIFVNLFFHKPIFNFLSIFLGLSAIALSYNGTIKRKCIFVFYILAVSCLIDLVVSAFLIKPFGYDGYSAFVSIFALLLLHATQLITERFFENDLGIELNNRYWLFIIASLLVCIITSIFMDKIVSSFSLSLVCGAFLLVNIIISYLMDDLVKSSQKALEINYLMDSLVVEISNRCLQKVIFKGGLPVTTKQSVREHGYGLKNVKKVLDKYISTLDFECSDERFTVEILMKI